MQYTQADSGAWWLAERFNKQPHDLLLPYIERLVNEQAGRFENMRRYIAAYERGSKYRHRDDLDDSVLTDKTIAFNHARNGVDTVHCKWVKSRILPMALTIGGGAIERERAKTLEKALHGELRKNDWELIEEQAGLDALVCSIAWAHILHGVPSLTIDWVPAEDVIFDVAETRQKKAPRFIARRFLMDRYVAMEKWGQKGDGFYGSAATRLARIRRCKAANNTSRKRDQDANVIEVWAAFHQRSGEDAKDGKYAVVIDGATMEYSDWDRDYIPLAPLVPYPRMRQLYGLSLMADFLPIQEEHDKLSTRIQQAHHRIGGTHVIAARETNVDFRELSNAQGTHVSYDAGGGPPPKEFNPTPVNVQTYEYREGLIAEMYRAKGIPEMTATGAVPEGMAGSSGKAWQVTEEQVAERLLVPFRARDRFMKAVSWRVIEEARAIAENDSSYGVKYKGERRALEKIKWKDALMDKEEFDLDLFPINALSKSPAAKFAQLTELLKAGAIQVEQFRRLFELPDLEAENEVDMADIEVIDKVMDQIIIEGKALQPEPFDYLKLIIQRGRKFYNLCRKKEVPEERLAYLRDYLVRAKEMDDEETAKMAALQNPQGQAMPGGAVGPIQNPNMPPPQAAAA
jgi:hypothetical protein